tara:strand:- start:474 stop:665 length:192 start_codon:yes stop_codon:yes gene_type:complete
MPEISNYDVGFRAPVLPYFPDEYDRQTMEQFTNVLRLYFNQLDNAIRTASSTDKTDAQAWFVD